MNESDGQELIEAFFAALTMRELEQCEAVLAELQSLSQKQPVYEHWCTYLHGILANERDRDYAEAERIFKHSLLADLTLELRGRVLIALGRTCHYQGHWADAIDAYEHSLPVFAELDQLLDRIKAWKEIAISYRKGFTQGDFGPEALQHAAQFCQLALDALEPITEPSPDVAWLKGSVWNTLGLVHRSLGQWDEAISCYQQDLAICRLLDDRFGMGLSYGNLGEIYQKLGRDRWSEAMEAYQQALDIIREFKDPYEEAEVLANLGFLHQEMSEYRRALDYYDQAIELAEDLRAQSSSEAARAGFFATIADTYANSVLLCLEIGDHRRAFDTVERARARAFLDALAVRSSELARKMATRTLTLAEVQAALPPDALLIEYFTTGLVEARGGQPTAGQDAQRHRFPPAKTLTFAITRDTVQMHDAGVSPNDLRPRQLDSVVERHFLAPEIRRTLYDRLLAPVAHLLQDKRRLYLLPHGPLHYVPFQALIAPDGETLLREGGPQLIYAPSATLLLHSSPKKSDRTQATCLALGFNGEGTMWMRFAEEEALSVSQLVGGHALVGPSAKKASLFDQAANYRLLHFSCHGEFDPETPLSSALHLAPGETLTALEVLDHLRLDCDLATLSACESGLSRVRRGDELVGLIRAFMHAGAPTLVSTLWCVDERSTLILMERFYRGIQSGLGFAEALQRAQLYLRGLTHKGALDAWGRLLTNEIPDPVLSLNQSPSDLPATEERIFADPYYWAPFILVGKHGS